MAVLAAPNEKLEAAKYFETCEKPQFDKAVILYEKAGYIGKAVDLAFETNQHNVLQFISSNFNESTEPLLLDKTASFFLQNEQYEKVTSIINYYYLVFNKHSKKRCSQNKHQYLKEFL